MSAPRIVTLGGEGLPIPHFDSMGRRIEIELPVNAAGCESDLALHLFAAEIGRMRAQWPGMDIAMGVRMHGAKLAISGEAVLGGEVVAIPLDPVGPGKIP